MITILNEVLSVMLWLESNTHSNELFDSDGTRDGLYTQESGRWSAVIVRCHGPLSWSAVMVETNYQSQATTGDRTFIMFCLSVVTKHQFGNFFCR